MEISDDGRAPQGSLSPTVHGSPGPLGLFSSNLGMPATVAQAMKQELDVVAELDVPLSAVLPDARSASISGAGSSSSPIDLTTIAEHAIAPEAVAAGPVVGQTEVPAFEGPVVSSDDVASLTSPLVAQPLKRVAEAGEEVQEERPSKRQCTPSQSPVASSDPERGTLVPATFEETSEIKAEEGEEDQLMDEDEDDTNDALDSDQGEREMGKVHLELLYTLWGGRKACRVCL